MTVKNFSHGKVCGNSKLKIRKKENRCFFGRPYMA
jgi:hypothetical protein